MGSNTTKKKVVTLGEIMLRLSTPGFSRFVQADNFDATYGGSEANVALSLIQFGVDATHVTRFPKNDLGEAAVQSLRRHGMDTSHIVFGDERMGIYFLENGAMQRSSRIIYDRFDSAFAHIRPGMIDWKNVLKDADWFHWTGITPAISQGAADVCLEALEEASRLGISVSGDINYRRNLWQYGKGAIDVMPALIKHTHYIIAGIADLENCLGIGGNDYKTACSKAMAAYSNIRKITSTNRESVSSSHNRISAHLWDGKHEITSSTYDLTHIVDRVGTGDAYMGGLIYGWINGKSDADTLEFATAACAWKHSIWGDVSLATVQEIEQLQRGENVGKLLR